MNVVSTGFGGYLSRNNLLMLGARTPISVSGIHTNITFSINIADSERNVGIRIRYIGI